MGKAEGVRNAVATIKEYCDNRKCARGEPCLFRDNSDAPYYCGLYCQPMYWKPKRLKTRREVYLEKFPNAKCAPNGTCAAYVFGGDCISCCSDCWDLPAPDEFQEGL